MPEGKVGGLAPHPIRATLEKLCGMCRCGEGWLCSQPGVGTGVDAVEVEKNLRLTQITYGSLKETAALRVEILLFRDLRIKKR